MENKIDITKNGYVNLVWILIFVGIAISMTAGMFSTFQPCNRFSSYFMELAGILIGFGMGLSVSRGFKIKGIDK